MTAYKRLVVADSISEFVVLHEKYMRYIQFPGFVLAAKLSTLTENLLDHVVVSFVPIYFRLHHQYRNILVKCLVIL